MTLHFDLLGLPRITLGGRLIELPPKSLALIAYLLINGRSKRETLATILWPNVSANPRNNLSQERSSLSNHLGFDILEGSKEFLAVQETVTCDALTFVEQSTTTPHAAWSLYRGDFLAGIEFHPHLLGNRAFGEEYEGWLSQQRSEFDGLWRQLSLGLATEEIKRGAIERAIPLLKTPLQNKHSISEDASRLLMLCHSILGQSDQVLQVFIQIADHLQAAIGVKPMRFTQEVFGVSRDEPQNAVELLHN